MRLETATASELCAALQVREISSREVTEYFLSRALADECGAFVAVEAERALERAAELDSITPTGTIHGMPLADKDLQLRAGSITTFGSRGFVGHVAQKTDRLSAALDASGAVSIGKTATSEFGFTAYTSSLAHGHTTIPGQPLFGAGGSSGGAAAAVAAGALPFAPGSDAGGSVRIPAAACGIVGLKASRGRVPVKSGQGTLGQLLVAGALARTVADAALLLSAMIDGSPDYPRGALSCPEPFDPAIPVGGKPRLIGVLSGFEPWAEIVDAPHSAPAQLAQHSAVAALERAGHRVSEVQGPQLPGYARSFLTLWRANAAALPLTPAQLELLEPFTRDLVEKGKALGAAEIVAAVENLFDHESRIIAAFAPYDAVLTPTTALPPRPVGWFPSDPEENFVAQCRYAPDTSFVNVAGLPAISVPTVRIDGGLSMSVQLIGKPGGESILLQLGAELEGALGADLAANRSLGK